MVKSANVDNISISNGSIDVGAKVALINVSNVWSAPQVATPSTLTSGTSISIDAGLSNIFTLTLSHNATLATPTNLAAGGRYSIIITQDGTGSRTLAYSSVYKFKNGSDNVLSTAAGAVDILICVSDGTDLYCALAKEFV